MLKKFVLKSVRSLMLHRLRTFLSTLGILFGVAAVVAMLSIGEGAKRETLEQIEQLGIHTIMIKQNTLSELQQQKARENLSQGLTVEDAARIYKTIPHIQLYAGIKTIKASLPGASLQNMSPEILAVSRSYEEIKSLKLAQGRFICEEDQKQKNLVCVLGDDVATALGPWGELGKTLRIENTLYTIVGILKQNQGKGAKNAFLATKNINQAVFIPLGSENTLRNFTYPENDTLSEIILKIEPNRSMAKIAGMVKNVLKYNHRGYDDYQIIIPQELLNQANETQRTFNQVLGSIAAISLLVGGIGIMNMMLANVTERIREIGIRRALGATKRNILLQFLGETILLTLLGALLGIAGGLLFSVGIAYFAGWKTVVTLWSILLSLTMAIFVGICSGLYPAYQASQLHPIVALRHE